MWEEPVTNWSGEKNKDGKYVGSRFNAKDFNRIKNNLQHLRDMAIQMYNEFNINSLGDDRKCTDYFYADEINVLEENLNTINNNTLKQDYGTTPHYVDNGPTMDYNELNRIEQATLNLYNILTNQYNGRRRFPWNFGINGGGL